MALSVRSLFEYQFALIDEGKRLKLKVFGGHLSDKLAEVCNQYNK